MQQKRGYMSVEHFFFSSINDTADYRIACVSELKRYSEDNARTVYVIDKPLSIDTDYEYNNALVVLMPNHKIVFIDLGDDCDGFEAFREDFIEDLSFLSNKYGYIKTLGRPREWRDSMFEVLAYRDNSFAQFSEILDGTYLEEICDRRRVDFLISLLLGSIQDASTMELKAGSDFLEEVKRRIVLFDGQQSRFIYQPTTKKRIRIQGLAGTGKTELLLHKLRELYSKVDQNGNKNRIAFTCFNKVLAEKMRKRIPQFFNFMKVEEQIEWDRHLWVFHSWGSPKHPNRGLYGYLCNHYNLNYQPFSQSKSFEMICEEAVNELHNKSEITPCFDYLLIDEAQDFGESFFTLCELVTKESIFIAGDVFQNIYDRSVAGSVEVDYLLSNCYRTDSRTLMLAHAIGMGLYETPIIRWLQDKEWRDCGYLFEKTGESRAKITRRPINRFGIDIDETQADGLVLLASEVSDFSQNVLDTIEQLTKTYPTIKPDDVAVVFSGNRQINYRIADDLTIGIKETFGWDTIKGYEKKAVPDNTLFISNVNNIKGLEFPFIICFTEGDIGRYPLLRNSLYMILTRSFITTYFIVDSRNEGFISIYSKAAESINKDNEMLVRFPNRKEIDEQETQLKLATEASKRPLTSMIDDCLAEREGISEETREKVKKATLELLQGESDATEEKVWELTDSIIDSLCQLNND